MLATYMPFHSVVNVFLSVTCTVFNHADSHEKYRINLVLLHCWTFWSSGSECLLTPPESAPWLGNLSCPQSTGATREPFREPHIRLWLALNLSDLLTLLGTLAPDLDRCLKLGYVNKPQIVSIARPDIPPISNEDEQLNRFAPYFLCSVVLSLRYFPAMSTSQCWFWTTP